MYLSSARIAAKRVFVVLIKQFRVSYYLSRWKSEEEMNTVPKDCFIWHIMIANDHEYEGTLKFREDIERDG